MELCMLVSWYSVILLFLHWFFGLSPQDEVHYVPPGVLFAPCLSSVCVTLSFLLSTL